MTKRSIIVGILGAILIAAGGRYAANHIPGMRGVILGHMPVTVFGLLFVFLIALNPLLGRIRSSLRFGPKETALAFALVLVACSIPTAGLMRYFPRTLVHPMVHYRTEPAWQKMKLMEYTPPALLANDARYSEEVVDDYIRPMGEPGHPISLSQVPWHAWWKALLVWGGIILCVKLGQLSLSVLVHNQWATRERIRYPLAELASSLLKTDESGRTSIFSNRLFWYGMGGMATLRLIKSLHHFFPGFPEIPFEFDFSPIKDNFPEFMKTPGAGEFLRPTLYPAVIGLTYLLASDIGFSLGISNLITVGVLFTLMSAGWDISSSQMNGGLPAWQTFGSFLAMGLVLVYTGRRLYWQTLKQAVTGRTQPEADATGVWALRAFLFSMIAVTVILSAVGLDWPIAVIAMAVLMLLFLVCARMNAECGTFYFAPGWVMPGILMGLFGLTVLGPKLVIILGLLFYVLSFDPFESLMPYASNGLKITSDAGLRVGRTGIWFAVALVLAIVVAVVTALWSDYNLASDMRHGGDTKEIYDAAMRSATQLSLAGSLDEVAGYSSWERLLQFRPQGAFLAAAGVGFFLLLGCSALRLRFAWWPIHPVAFLGFGSWTMAKFGFAFFVGWAIRAVVNKFAGPAGYTRLRPAMIGIVVGDLTGGFILMIIGWLFYAIAGTTGTSVMLW